MGQLTQLTEERSEPWSLGRGFVRAVLLGWVASVAIDFFLNAGIFAGYFASGDVFLLSPQAAFLRIPVGYASLLLLDIVLGLLIYNGTGTMISRARKTVLAYAIAVSASTVLGLWSITVAPPTFLAIWFADLLIELTVAGLVISTAKFSASRHLARYVAIGGIGCFVGGIVLQNTLG